MKKLQYQVTVDGAVAGTRQSHRIYTHAVAVRGARPDAYTRTVGAPATEEAWGVWSYHGSAAASAAGVQAASKAYAQVRVVPVEVR